MSQFASPQRLHLTDQAACGPVWIGWLWLALGTLALASPVLPVAWQEAVLGGTLVLGGSAQSVVALRRPAGWMAPCLLAGGSALVAGAVLLTHVLGGILPFVLSLFFAAQGVSAAWLALRLRGGEARVAMLISALMAVLLVLAIVAGWFCGAYRWLGAALGAERVLAGLALWRIEPPAPRSPAAADKPA